MPARGKQIFADLWTRSKSRRTYGTMGTRVVLWTYHETSGEWKITPIAEYASEIEAEREARKLTGENHEKTSRQRFSQGSTANPTGSNQP